MRPEVLSKLQADAKALYGVYTQCGAVNILPIPQRQSIIVTKIKLKAFCDLENGLDFRDAPNVGRFAQHQLRVFGTRGQAVFQARHNLGLVWDAVTNVPYTLPQGEHVWDVWLPQEQYVIFELSRFPRVGEILPIYTVNNERVPAQVRLPQPPVSYGVSPNAASIPVTSHLYSVPLDFEIKPFNKYFTPKITNQEFYQLEWPITADSRLNDPQLNIEFGIYTLPVLEVHYILINKAPDDATFPANV